MKHTSKLAYLLGLPVLVGLSALFSINVANGNVSIRIPLLEDLHRSQLYSLFLGNTETKAWLNVDLDNRKLNVLNGLVMGHNTAAQPGASFVSIGGGRDNNVGSVEKSGIGGGIGNKVESNNSVIGGGRRNSTSGGVYGVNTVAGGSDNQAGNGGVIVGGGKNIVDGESVIVGGYNNSVGGAGSMILGSNSKGGDGSFSWNSTIEQDFSAIIMADSGVLIGTYYPVTGVNLVVDGAIKVGNNDNDGIVGEIKLQSGCFYGYDGSIWHVINRGLGNECSNIGMTCNFGSVVLQPHETVKAYSEPYAENCIIEEVECNEDGILGEAGKTYYPYCHAWGGVSCGSANGQSYTTSPTEGLCGSGRVENFQERGNTYRWSCVNGSKSVNCYAEKLSGCQGNEPTGAGVKKGSSNGLASWSYVDQQPGECQWTCDAGYVRVSGKDRCEIIPNGASAKCGSAAGGTYATFPEEGLCDSGTPKAKHEGDNLYTWECQNGNNYVSCSAIRDRSSFSCVSTNRMLGDADAVKPISGPSPYEDVEKQLFASIADVPEGQYCAYICNEDKGWHYFPGGIRNGQTVQKRCARCVQGTEQYDSNGNVEYCTELIDVCPHNYYYKLETNQCLAYGNCLWNENIENKILSNSNITNMEAVNLARPIGENKNWTQKTNADDVEDHQCQFVCEPGFVPNRLYSRGNEYDIFGCIEILCYDRGNYSSNATLHRQNGETQENPIHWDMAGIWNYGNKYQYYSTRQYMSATDSGNFYDKVSNLNGCYFWCPEDRLCKLHYSTHKSTRYSNYWTCYGSAEEKESNCVESVGGGGGNSRICSGYNPTLKGYYTRTRTAYGQNRNFQTYTTPGEYQSHQSEGCYQGCTSEATEVITGPNGETICWKQCPQNQYFSINGGGCTSCSNNRMKPDPNNMFNGNSLGCVPKCGEGLILCQDCGNDGGEACIQTVINLNAECEDGSEPQYNEMLDRYECVYDVYVYEEDGD